MTDNSAFHDIFGETRLMAILRGMGVERTLAVAARAWDLGITVIEVPVQAATDIEALRVVAAAARTRGLIVGAGTVVTPEHVTQAKEAGAAFTVSPGLDIDIVRASHALGMPSIPGVATPTEVQRAMADGLTWMKAFPASVLGTGWFSAMRGPFPHASFVATGGMDSGNAREYLDAGAHVIAVGAALEDDAQLPELAALV